VYGGVTNGGGGRSGSGVVSDDKRSGVRCRRAAGGTAVLVGLNLWCSRLSCDGCEDSASRATDSNIERVARLGVTSGTAAPAAAVDSCAGGGADDVIVEADSSRVAEGSRRWSSEPDVLSSGFGRLFSL